MTKEQHTNFLLVIIIVGLAMFILLCPRKTTGGFQPNNNTYMNNNNQQLSEYLAGNNLLTNLDTNQYNYFEMPVDITEHEYSIINPELINSRETVKFNTIQQQNMDYDTRGDINDLININQLPSSGSMFVYP